MTIAIINLIHIIISVLIGGICACFTRLVMFCIGDPHIDPDTKEEKVSKNIFSFYGRYILRKYIAADLKKKYSDINYWKAAGMCPFCFNVHFTLLLSWFILYKMEMPYWWSILINPISYFFLTRIYANEYE